MALVDDTLGIEVLVQKLTDYMDARREHDEAYQEFVDGGGYSWGYYGRSYVDRYETRARAFGDALESFIDARVAKALEQREDDR